MDQNERGCWMRDLQTGGHCPRPVRGGGDGSHPSSVSGLLGRGFACAETLGYLLPLLWAAGKDEGLSPFLKPLRVRLACAYVINLVKILGVYSVLVPIRTCPAV